MAVRSKLLGFGQAAGYSRESVYYVPAGHTTICKRLTAYNAGSVDAYVWWFLQPGPFTILIPIWAAVIQPGFTDDHETWVVAPEGALLGCDIYLDTIDYSLSGAELLGVS